MCQHNTMNNYPYGNSPAVDMHSLKTQIIYAKAGTGAVAKAIKDATFSPRHNAFTSLLNLVSKARDAEKAVEIFEAMQTYAGISPNIFTYSAIISSFAKSGHWELAQQYFDELQKKSQYDSNLKPNTVTYAALIAAHEKRGSKEGIDRALALFYEQKEHGVQADTITYASLIAACERQGELTTALKLVDEMHAGGMLAKTQVYNRLIAACKTDWNTALELFLTIQYLGVELTPATVEVLLGVFTAAGQHQHAVRLLTQCGQMGWSLPPVAYTNLLCLLAKAKQWKSVHAVLVDMHSKQMKPDPSLAAILVAGQASGGSNGIQQFDAISRLLGVYWARPKQSQQAIGGNGGMLDHTQHVFGVGPTGVLSSSSSPPPPQEGDEELAMAAVVANTNGAVQGKEGNEQVESDLVVVVEQHIIEQGVIEIDDQVKQLEEQLEANTPALQKSEPVGNTMNKIESEQPPLVFVSECTIDQLD